MGVKKNKLPTIVEWVIAGLVVLFTGLLVWTFLQFLVFVEAMLELML